MDVDPDQFVNDVIYRVAYNRARQAAERIEYLHGDDPAVLDARLAELKAELLLGIEDTDGIQGIEDACTPGRPPRR